MSELAYIRKRVDCRGLLESYGVKFASGANGNAHCFHSANHANGDRNPSMRIHADGKFQCFGCGETGDVFDVVQYFNSCDFVTAKQTLAERAGVELAGFNTGGRVARYSDFADLTKPAPIAPPTVDATRREILGRIWDCLVFAEQPATLFEYGRQRGVSEYAMRMSVRDWSAAADEIRKVLNDGFKRSDLIAAGVLKADGKFWRPFDELRSIADGKRTTASGFVIPVFDGESSAPVAFRWRIYNPSGSLKAMAQPAGAPLLPVGLDTLQRAKATGKPFTVIVCEGETDWLAAVDAARIAGINAAVLSHCTMSTAWRPEWSAMIADAERVLIGFDYGKGDKPAGVERAREIVNQLGKDWIDRITVRLTKEGANDLADLHKNGNLAPLFERLAATAEQETHTQQLQVAGVM